jgi:hypothetical protein
MKTEPIKPGGTFVGIYGGFSVVILRNGDRYGLDNCLTWVQDNPAVEFFDARYTGPGFTTVGQFVSRYYLATLRDHPLDRGLCLDGGVKAWSIDASAFATAMQAVEFALK